jgi:hypothetical protein
MTFSSNTLSIVGVWPAPVGPLDEAHAELEAADEPPLLVVGVGPEGGVCRRRNPVQGCRGPVDGIYRSVGMILILLLLLLMLMLMVLLLLLLLLYLLTNN